MGNGLFDNLGVDVAALVNEHISPSLLVATITMGAAAGARPSGELTKGPAKGSDASYIGRGFIGDFTPNEFKSFATLVAGDRKVVVVIESFTPALPRDPGNGDTVQLEGTTYRIERVLRRDPAAATFVLQVRDL